MIMLFCINVNGKEVFQKPSSPYLCYIFLESAMAELGRLLIYEACRDWLVSGNYFLDICLFVAITVQSYDFFYF